MGRMAYWYFIAPEAAKELLLWGIPIRALTTSIMNIELEGTLCRRYPRIFSELQASENPSRMAWRIMCGDGWFDLLDALCSSLQFQTDRCAAPQVVALQIKEKFGVLSFHRREASETQRGMIAMAEAMSTRICEKCGKPGQILLGDSLRQTLCTEHAPDHARPLGVDSLSK